MLQYMLDTDTVIYTLKHKPASVREAFNRNDGRLCISSITYMELVFGAINRGLKFVRQRLCLAPDL